MNAGTNAPKTNTNVPKPNADAVPDVSNNPVVRKSLKLDQEITVTNNDKKYAAKITGIQVTYTTAAPTIFSNTDVLTDDSAIEVAQVGGVSRRRRTNRRRRSSRRN